MLALARTYTFFAESRGKLTHYDERCCTEAELIGAQHSRNDNIEAGAELAIGLQDDSIQTDWDEVE